MSKSTLSRRFLLGAENKIGEYGTQNTRSQDRQIDLGHAQFIHPISLGRFLLAHELVEQKRYSNRKNNYADHSQIDPSQLVHFLLSELHAPSSKEPFSYQSNLNLSSARSNEDFKAIAFPGSVLLKRTHHVGEEAKDHSQTHDPGRTQGVPKEAWPHAEGSCEIAGCRIGYRSGLGDRKKQNPQIFVFHPNLPGKRKNSLIFLPNSLRNKFLFPFYSTKGGLDLLGF